MRLTLFRLRHIIKIGDVGMEFLTTKQASELWKISQRRITKLCEENRIKSGKYIKIKE